jgi:hypothetical protein
MRRLCVPQVSTAVVVLCLIWVGAGCGRSTHEVAHAASGGKGGAALIGGAGATSAASGAASAGRAASGGAFVSGGSAGNPHSGAPAGGSVDCEGGGGTTAVGGGGQSPVGTSGQAGAAGTDGNSAGGEAGTTTGGCVPPPVFDGPEVSTCCAGKPCRGTCTGEGICHCGGLAEGCSAGEACCTAPAPACRSASEKCSP